MNTKMPILPLLFVLLCLCACGHKPYPQALIAADSLASANPDSAITLLKSIESTMQAEPEATRMYYRLLCIKANDKAYILHTSDSLILPVLHYYIGKDDERHLPEAYYYAGRVYRDLGDAPQALDYFQKAAEALPENGGYRLKSKIYSQMGTIRRMHSLYNYQLREKENSRLKAENNRQTSWIYLISGGLAISILSFIAYRQHSKRKRLELERQLDKLRTIEKENREKIESLERYKVQKEELEKNLADISIPENSQQKRQLNRKIELLNHILQQKVIENEQEKEAQSYLFSSDIYKKLQERANSARGEAYVNPEEWEILKELMPPAYPNFFERLHSLHTPNENELHVCMLVKLQFRQADIARLLQLKPESISSIRRRLYQKVTGEKGAPELWDKVIDSL